jgi:hypothetical protein
MNIDPSFIIEIGKAFLYLITGLVIGYFTHRYQVKHDKANVQRDRLLKNIAKLEDYVNMTVEFSFVEKDFLTLEKEMDAKYKYMEIFEQQFAWVNDEIQFVSNEINQNPSDEKKLQELQDRLTILKKHLLELRKKLGEEKISAKMLQEYERLKLAAEEAKKRFILDDIGATGLTIDPSGKLADYILELQKISSDRERNYYSDKRAIELRSKINHLFDEIIRKTG